MNTLVPIGILLSVIGLLAIGGALVSARLAGQRRQVLIGSEDPVIPVSLASVNDAVIVARVGGQVIFANQAARDWFGLDGDDPDLWLLAQRAAPTDAFLELFAAEGQAAFAIGSRKVEATSHRVTVGDSAQLIVVIREEALLPVLDHDERGSSRSLQVLGEVTQAINASLALPDTLQATLGGLRRLIACDAAQICLWDAQQELLRPAARSGPDDYVQATHDEDQAYRRDEGFPGWIALKRQPLLVPDVSKADSVEFGKGERPIRLADPPAGSYLGVPLTVRRRFIGTLEITASQPHCFDREDQALLALLAEQAAVAVENAREYSAQAERVAELSGLQQIAESISMLPDPRHLYARLGQRVAELMGTDMAGVLLYDREQERLVAQPPFHGMVDALAARYTISLRKGTPARSLWEDVTYWFSNDLAGDRLVNELGLGDLVEMAGAQTTALAAMTVGDERIGVLQVSNKVDGSPFTLPDIRLLQAYANQTAVVVESARLYGQEQSRVAELQGLQQIVQAMSAFTNPEELYAQLTRRIAELIGVAICGILIYEPDEEQLVACTPFAGIPDEVAQAYAIPVGRRGLAREVWREHDLYLSNHIFTDETVDLMGLRAIARAAGLQTVLLAPLSAGGRRFGFLQVSNKLDGTEFNDDDQRLVALFAGQAAALIENARLYQDTDATLHKRAAELRSVSRISHELNSTLELDRILEVIAVEARRAEGARWGSLAIFDWNNERTEIMSTTTFGDRLGVEARTLEKVVAYGKETLVVEDFDRASHYPRPVDGARSALIVPVLFEGYVIGAIALYGDRPRALGPGAAEFVQALSSQATIAVTNTARHAEQVERSELLRRRAEQMTHIFELGRAFRSDQSIEGNLVSVARAIAESVGFDTVLIGVLDEKRRTLRFMAQSGLKAPAFKRLATRPIPWPSVQRHLDERYRLGNAYLVPPTESAPLIKTLALPGPEEPELAAALAADGMPGRWQPGNLLLVHLRSSNDEELGVLLVDQPRNHAVPDQDAIELLEIFSNQAALVVENTRLYRSVEERAEELGRSLKNLERSYQRLDKLSQEMMRKDVELSQANDLLNVRAQRLLALHRIMESLDTTRSPDEVLGDIAASVVEEMDVDQCLIALADEAQGGALRLVAAEGRIPSGLDCVALLAEHDLLADVLQTQEALVYAPGGKRSTPAARLARQLGASTFVALPLTLDPARGLLLIGSTRRGAAFGDDDRDLFALLASQIAVEVENARLVVAVQDEAAAAARERDRLQQLHLITTALQQTRDLHDRLAIIARGLRSVGWRRVAAMMLDADQQIAHITTAGYTPEEEAALPGTLLPGGIWARRFDDEGFLSTRLGACHYLAHDHPWVLENVEGAAQAAQAAEVGPGEWHPADQVYLPMYAGLDIIGVISLRDPENGLRPTDSSLRPIELFVQQASSALENTRLYQETLELQSYTEAVVQSIQQGIVVVDAAGVVETVNAFLRERYGWGDELVAQNLFDAQPTLRELGLADDFAAVLGSGEPVERPAVQIAVEGVVHHLSVYIYPRVDEQRAVTGAVLLLEDITQRARLEADIARRGEQLAALNEVSRGITATLSLDDVVSSALDEAGRVIPFDHLELWLRDRQDVRAVRLAGARGQGPDDAIGLTVEVSTVPQFDQIERDNLPLVLEDRPPTETAGGGRHTLRSWLGVPMVSGGAMLGIMVFERTEAHAYTPADAQIAAALANQIAVALENARLFEEAADRASELHNRTQRLALLNRISSTLGSSLDQNSILQTATDELREALLAPQASVILFDYEQAVGTLTIQSPSNPDGSVDAITISLDDNPAIERLLKTSAPLPITDVAADLLAVALRGALASRGTRSVLVIPIIIGKALIGVILIEHTGAIRPFETEQVELAQTITNQVAVSIQNAHLFQETVTRQRELGILLEAGRIAAASLDLDTVTRNAAEYFVQSLDVDGCTIALHDPARSLLLALAEHSRKDGARPPAEGDHLRDLKQLPTTASIIEARAARAVNVASPKLAAPDAAWLGGRGIVSALLVPLVARDEVIGLVELWQTRPDHPLNPREIRLARALADSLATAMENARLHDETERRLEELATINELSRALTQIISAEDLYQMLQDQIGKVVSASSLTLAQRDPLTGRLVFPLTVRGGKRVRRDPVEFGHDLYSLTIEKQEPLLLARDLDLRIKKLGVQHAEPGLKSFLAVPLTSGELSGVLALEDYEREDAFGEANLRVLSPIAAQVAVSLENARLYGELEQRLSETTTLQEVSRVVNSALELQEIFERVVRELASAFSYPLIGLYTLEDDELVMQAYHGYSESDAAQVRRLTLRSGISGRAARTGQPQLVRDTTHNGSAGRSEIAVPIVADDEVLGVLNVSSGSDNPLDKNDLTLLRTFAGQVSAAMINARLYEQMVRLSEELEQRVEERTQELREERDRIDTLYRIAVELTASLDLDTVLNSALQLVGKTVGAESGVLFLVDPQSDLLIHRASMHPDASLPPGGRQIATTRHEGLAGWMMDNRESLVIDNVQEDPRWVNVPGAEARRSLLGTPLVANDEVLGCIFFNSDVPGAFQPAHLRLVEAAANQVAGSINNAELYRMIRDQAERLGIMLRSQQTEAAKSQAILESVADGVMVSDESGEIILLNAAAERVLGLRRDQVLGRPADDLSGLYGPGAAQWAGVLASWQTDPGSYRGEFLSEQIDLDERIVSVHVSPVLHGSEYLGLVSVFRDITREALADRVKSEFVARVSHELRTPMTSIKGYADLLLLGAAGEITPEQRRFLETVKSNADRLSHLVNDLLDISRLEQGQVDLDFRPVDVCELVNEVLASFTGRMAEEGRELAITIDLPEDVPSIEADYDRLAQVMTNLIGNAYQYTPDDGSVTVRVLPNGDGIQIDVADTGIGIPDEDRERVFERFFRGENHPLVFKSAGTGLGLSIVQQLVEMHNGRVWFESEVGAGSTFSLWLPY